MTQTTSSELKAIALQIAAEVKALREELAAKRDAMGARVLDGGKIAELSAELRDLETQIELKEMAMGAAFKRAEAAGLVEQAERVEQAKAEIARLDADAYQGAMDAVKMLADASNLAAVALHNYREAAKIDRDYQLNAPIESAIFGNYLPVVVEAKTTVLRALQHHARFVENSPIKALIAEVFGS